VRAIDRNLAQHEQRCRIGFGFGKARARCAQRRPRRALIRLRVELPLGLARIETRLRRTLRLRPAGRESAKTNKEK